MSNPGQLSSFMKDQLSFRADQSKLIELSLNPHHDPKNTRFFIPEVFTSVSALSFLGFYSYYQVRKGSVTYHLIQNRNLSFRLRTMAWGTLSTLSFASSIYMAYRNYNPYVITEA